MTVYEIAALRGGYLLTPTEETRNFPPANLSILLEHLTTLEENGVATSYIFTPGKVVAGSEIIFFVAPPEGREITPGVRALNEFKNVVIANLLIPGSEPHNAGYANKQDVADNIMERLDTGSLAVPSITFEDERVVIESIFRVLELRTQDSPVTRILGLSDQFGNPDEAHRRTVIRDRITTRVYFYHDQHIAHLIARSLQILKDRQHVIVGYNDIFNAYRDLVAAFIQRRHANQMQRHVFKITQPEAYLHSLSIPLTNEEAEGLHLQ